MDSFRKNIGVSDRVKIAWVSVPDSIGQVDSEGNLGECLRHTDGSYTIKYVSGREMIETIIHELYHVKQWEENRVRSCEEAETFAMNFVNRGRK